MNDDDDDRDDIVRLDFVDALSLPIQAMSQVEKRTRQMRGMGIDENDIGDVQTLNSKTRPDPMDGGGIGGGGPGGGGGAVPLLNNTPVTQRAISIVSMPQTPNATLSFDKKDRKGEHQVLDLIAVVIAWLLFYRISLCLMLVQSNLIVLST